MDEIKESNLASLAVKTNTKKDVNELKKELHLKNVDELICKLVREYKEQRK